MFREEDLLRLMELNWEGIKMDGWDGKGGDVND
jgi:hypothetical protein